MARILRTFFRGLVSIIPLLLTVSLIVWMVRASERLFSTLFLLVLPEEYYVPGLGLTVAVLLTFFVGVLTRSRYLRLRFGRIEQALIKIPLFRTVYSSIKDFMTFFSDRDRKFSQAVMVKIPNSEQLVLGFVTSETPHLTFGEVADGKTAVYFPMSYQIGGYTLFVDKEQIFTVETNSEDVLRYIITAGVSGK